MNKFSLLFLVLSIHSCHLFDYNKLNTKDIVTQEVRNIDWGEVDDYPSFPLCDTIYDATDRVNCFYSEFHKRVIHNLAGFSFVPNQKVSDTINILFEINHSGKLKVIKLDLSTKIKAAIPGIDTIVNQSVTMISDLSPAFKRGQPVKTVLEIPLLITN